MNIEKIQIDWKHLVKPGHSDVVEAIERLGKSLGINSAIVIVLVALNEALEKRLLRHPEKLQNPMPGYVYLMKMCGYYKIGYSQDPTTRSKEIGVLAPMQPEIVHTIFTNNMRETEAVFHYQFREKRIRGEWFDLSEDDVRDFCKFRIVNEYNEQAIYDFYAEHCLDNLPSSMYGYFGYVDNSIDVDASFEEH